MYTALKSLFALVTLMLVLVLPASAGYVDHTSACIVATSGDQYVLLADGTVWGVASGGWIQDTVAPPMPVPVSSIKFWEWARWMYFVDMSDNTWVFIGSNWRNLGSPPNCGATNVQKSTWGQLKVNYR